MKYFIFIYAIPFITGVVTAANEIGWFNGLPGIALNLGICLTSVSIYNLTND